MYRNIEAHRRILFLAYRRYLGADQALQSARSNALKWFPEAPGRNTMLMGDPGSRIRRLYDSRERALARLTLVREALEEAHHLVSRGMKRSRILIEVR